ncbi:uncharacterized protein F5147DRAFT_577029 [Suillus discolor]|uniref:Uncharacterized protein n=1 Tax=Suillus discolor TaxID=1912936 RepID=A0A9P7JU01_9AGAM|nr:uncharacterized protein F5147DRAFT_577029 [Suillus discolor]KAG2108188.1 hypothetical protein F5147DRAFT_577029 [Suillus discolor]
MCSFARCKSARLTPIRSYQLNARACVLQISSSSRSLKYYRRFEMPRGTKFEAWLWRLFEHPAFKKICSCKR